MDPTSFLGPLGKLIDEFRGRPRFRVTIERNISIDHAAPVDRYLVWGGDQRKKYHLLGIQNLSTKPARFMRGTLENTALSYPRILTKANDGVELVYNETTHFLLEADQVGDLVGATLKIQAIGWEKTYPVPVDK